MTMEASLKQRLVGAVVLVALAVIFLPLLVKGPAPDSGVTGVSLTVPPPPKKTAPTVTQDLPLVTPAAVPENGVSGMPQAAPADAQPADGEASDPPLAAVAAGNFIVSFGSYASQTDANKVIAALRGIGLPSTSQKATVAGKTVQSVRIGPFADRAVAESARVRASSLGSSVVAKVLALDADTASAPPDAASKPAASKPVAVAPKLEAKPTSADKPVAAPVKPAATKPAVAEKTTAEPPPTKPANPAGTGFVVQIGAFASTADAIKQRDALRAAGFNAFTDTVPSTHGTLTRVRVGPVISRAEADALKARVKAKAHLDGMVRSHP